MAAATVALLSWLGFALHWRETIMATALPPLGALWHQAIYFTETTNFAVAVVFTLIAARGDLPSIRWPVPGLAVAVSLVGIVYWSILYPAHPPRSDGVWSNILIHAVTPLAVIWACIAYPADRPISAWAPARWLIYPTLYTCYILVRGGITDQYPYAFNDPSIVGPARWAATNLGLAVGIFLWGSILRRVLNWRAANANGLDRLARQL
jgi:hypothetical protein